MVTHKKFTHDSHVYTIQGIDGEHIFKQIPWYEKKLLNKIQSLQIGNTYIDVGANIGNHSMFFLNHCTSKKLYAFEPEKTNVTNLTFNLKNSIKPFVIEQKGVASQNDTMYMNVSKIHNINSGNGFIDKSNGDYQIDVVSLDNYFSDKNEVIGLIKIDVEGLELEILKGCTEIIKKFKPVLILEAHTTDKFNSYNSLLSNLGYKTDRVNYATTPTYIWKI